MNLKHYFGEIGSIIIISVSIIYVFLPNFIVIDKSMLLLFFLLVIFSIFLIGFGFSDKIKFQEKINLILGFSIVTSISFLISFLTVIPNINTFTQIYIRYVIWFISYILLGSFFVLLGIGLLMKKVCSGFHYFSSIIIPTATSKTIPFN